MSESVIKINKSDSNMKSCGIYAGGIYRTCGGQILNERNEWVNISWWNMDYTTLEKL